MSRESRKAFATALSLEINQLSIDESVSAKLLEVPKPGGKIEYVLTIRKGEDVVKPMLDTEHYFKEFEDETEAAKDILFSNYELANSTVIPIATGTLEDCTTTPLCEGLFLYYAVPYSDGTIRKVFDGDLISWEIKKEELESCAKRNISSKKAFSVPLSEYAGETGEQKLEEDFREDRVYVVSNRHQKYGSGEIINEKLMEFTAEELGAESMVVVFTSENEFLCVSEGEEYSWFEEAANENDQESGFEYGRSFVYKPKTKEFENTKS